MSITAYEYLSILQATEDAPGQARESGGFDYQGLLESVRAMIAEKHSKELSSALGSADDAKALKTLILKYCVDVLAGKEFEQDKQGWASSRITSMIRMLRKSTSMGTT